MGKHILVIIALESELPEAAIHMRQHANVTLLASGVGKVNAARATTAALLASRPSLVINYGTAGSLSPSIHALVEVGSVVQRDMMAMPFAPRGTTPFSPDAAILHSGQKGVVCGSGDSFVSGADEWMKEAHIDVVDMELFAIAHVCDHYGVPWRSFKYITDDASDGAAQDWAANVHKGEDLFWAALEQAKGVF